MSNYTTRPDPRGAEYGSFRIVFHPNFIEVSHWSADNLCDYTLHFIGEDTAGLSFDAWAADNLGRNLN